jgi:peroxiredoxin
MSEPSNLSALRAKLAARRDELDSAYRKSMNEAVEHLHAIGVASRAKKVGDRAPDFALAGRNGVPVMLSCLLRKGPVVLSFFRGEWCSFCRIEMGALIEACPRIVAEGAQLMLVSPQGPTEGLLERGAPIEGLTILQDPLNGVGLQYGLIFRMPDILREALQALGVDLSHLYGTDAWLLPIPATYIIRQDGIIALAHADPDFTHRLDPEHIISALVDLRRMQVA